MIFKQIMRFGIVGLIATIIDYVLLYFFTDFLNVHYLISAVISFSISLIVNYYLSIKWVFYMTKKQTYKELFLFAFLSLIGLIINELILYLGTELLNIYYMVCKIGATIIVMVYNFITRKIFIEK